MRNAKAVLAFLLVAVAPSLALAKSTQVLSYPPGEVWPTAIRYLRIDRGATLREKDAETGYVLFELPDDRNDKKSYKGALELVRTTDGDERESTRLVVNLPDLPRHFELTLLEKLAAKVKDEYGSPAPAPTKRPAGSEAPPRKPSDAGVLPRPERGELPRPERR